MSAASGNVAGKSLIHISVGHHIKGMIENRESGKFKARHADNSSLSSSLQTFIEGSDVII